MKIKKRLYLFLGMLIFTACFFYGSMHSQAAAAVNEESTISVHVLNGAGDAAGGIAETGEEHLDDSINRGIGLLEGLCKFLGIAIGIVGIVVGLIGFFGHQDDMKARFPILLSVAVGIFFAPEIFYFLVGK